MANTWWWVVVPPAEQNASTIPGDAKIISTPEGSAAYNTLLNTDSGTVQVGGQPYVRYMGPFATKADAQNAKPGNLTIVPGYTVTPSGQVQGPLSGLAAIGDFFSKLGQANTWLRVAEVLLGAGIIIVALAKLASDTPAGRAAVKAGKAAAIL